MTVPVIAAEKLVGIITLGDIANAYMDVYDNCILSRAKTSYRNILETIDAEVIVGDASGYFDSGEVVIATANPDVLEDYIHAGDMVLLGNRYETQLCAIEQHSVLPHQAQENHDIFFSSLSLEYLPSCP